MYKDNFTYILVQNLNCEIQIERKYHMHHSVLQVMIPQMQPQKKLRNLWKRRKRRLSRRLTSDFLIWSKIIFKTEDRKFWPLQPAFDAGQGYMFLCRTKQIGIVVTLLLQEVPSLNLGLRFVKYSTKCDGNSLPSMWYIHDFPHSLQMFE
jgi:hypothetical protein